MTAVSCHTVIGQHQTHKQHTNNTKQANHHHLLPNER